MPVKPISTPRKRWAKATTFSTSPMVSLVVAAAELVDHAQIVTIAPNITNHSNDRPLLPVQA
jgi:hypothetical protein